LRQVQTQCGGLEAAAFHDGQEGLHAKKVDLHAGDGIGIETARQSGLSRCENASRCGNGECFQEAAAEPR
jgi:hypothetical protein